MDACGVDEGVDLGVVVAVLVTQVVSQLEQQFAPNGLVAVHVRHILELWLACRQKEPLTTHCLTLTQPEF